jgi:hypothetical protein
MRRNKVSMKRKPQTIADLKINLTFDYWKNIIHQLELDFLKLNPTLADYKIAKGKYQFLIKNKWLTAYSGGSQSLSNFISWLHYQICFCNFKLPLKLVRFELVSKNKFKIHVK